MTCVGGLMNVNIPKGRKDGELDPLSAGRNGESDARALSLHCLACAQAGLCALQCRCAPPRAPRIRRVLPPAGNTIGAPVFSSARGELLQTHARTVSASHSAHSRPPALTSDYRCVAQNFVARDVFCIRACKDGPCAPANVDSCAWKNQRHGDTRPREVCAPFYPRSLRDLRR